MVRSVVVKSAENEIVLTKRNVFDQNQLSICEMESLKLRFIISLIDNRSDNFKQTMKLNFLDFIEMEI